MGERTIFRICLDNEDKMRVQVDANEQPLEVLLELLGQLDVMHAEIVAKCMQITEDMDDDELDDMHLLDTEV